MRTLVIAIFVAMLSSCTTSSSIHIVDPNSLPGDVYARPNVTGAPSRSTRVVIYLVEANRLAAVARTGQTKLTPHDVSVRALLRGPTQKELAQGLTSEVPPTVQLLDVSVRDAVASVDLSKDFAVFAQRQEFVLRVAQLVWTMSDLADVDSVRLLIEGRPQPVRDQDGNVVTGPVAPGRYDQFAPRSLSPVSEQPLQLG